MFEKVKSILLKYVQVPVEITANTQLIVDLGLNSLDTVNAVVEFEEKFDIEIKDRDIPKLATVQDIMNYIENYKT